MAVIISFRFGRSISWEPVGQIGDEIRERVSRIFAIIQGIAQESKMATTREGREMYVFYLTPFPVLLAEMREGNTARNFTSNGIYLVERKREIERENSLFFTIQLTRIPAVDIEVPRSSLDLYESKSISRRVHCKECDSPRITFCRWYLTCKLRRPVTLR